MAGELRAIEVSRTLLIFVAGRDSELGDLRHMPAAAKARSALWKMYEAWHGFSERRELGWGIPEWWKMFDVEPKAEHYREAREFDLERWIIDEIEASRHRAKLSALAADRALRTKAKRPERSIFNSVAAICGKELDYMRWLV